MRVSNEICLKKTMLFFDSEIVTFFVSSFGISNSGGGRTSFFFSFFPPKKCSASKDLILITSYSSPNGCGLYSKTSQRPALGDNVPRVPEVGDQREPIWVERSETLYSLLSAGAGFVIPHKLRHGCPLFYTPLESHL